MFHRPNHVGGINFQNKFGSNLNIPAGEMPQDVWDYGGVYPFPLSAKPTVLVSDNVEDGAGGNTGAWTVSIYGLDHNLQSLEISASMNGTDEVELTIEFYRVFRINVETAGSHETNIGNIDIKHGSTILARIQPNNGSTLMAVYTVSVDYKKCYLMKYYLEVGRLIGEGHLAVNAQFQVRKPDGAWQVKRPLTIDTRDASIWSYEFANPGLQIEPGSDLRWRILDINSGTALAHAGFDLREIR